MRTTQFHRIGRYPKERSEMQQQQNGIGFVGLLTILFIALKLTGHITWSWWWVLSPMWISALLGISILAIFFFVVLVIGNR